MTLQIIIPKPYALISKSSFQKMYELISYWTIHKNQNNFPNYIIVQIMLHDWVINTHSNSHKTLQLKCSQKTLRTGTQRQGMHINNGPILWTHLTSFPAVARKLGRSDHILRVIRALTEFSPSLTTWIFIGAVRMVSHDGVERIDMNPLCCWPFLTFNHRASTM